MSCIANRIGDTKNNGKKKQSDVGAGSSPRTSSTEPVASTSDDPGTVVGTILFAYDEAGHLIGEYDELGNRLREYVWLGDTPVVMVQDDGVYYIHVDHLNTPKVVTDQNQLVVWKGDYEPFGEVTETVDTVDMNLRFPGQYEDQETGLNYNYFRSYDSSIGRYTQSDPIGLSGGINPFTYVSAAPISRADPLGLVEWKVNQVSGSIVVFVGAWYAQFEATSECVNGKKATASIVATGPGVGLGLEYSGLPIDLSANENMIFRDSWRDPDPMVFNGAAAILAFSASLAPASVGSTDIKLGQAYYSPGTGEGASSAIGLSATFLSGSSTVVRSSIAECGCSN